MALYQGATSVVPISRLSEVIPSGLRPTRDLLFSDFFRSLFSGAVTAPAKPGFSL